MSLMKMEFHLTLRMWRSTKKCQRDERIFGVGKLLLRKFIAGFCRKVKPLVDLTRKNVKFYWTEECQQSFNNLKRALTGADVMAYPRDQGRFILDTDASDFAIGAVLSQEQNGQEKVLAYRSHTLGKSERADLLCHRQRAISCE